MILDVSELARLLARIADDDAEALHQFYNLTSAKMFGIIMRILPDQGDREDVLKEVYLTVWRRAGDYNAERMSPITWLTIMARNRAIDRRRAGVGPALVPIDRHTEGRSECTGSDYDCRTFTDFNSMRLATAMLCPCDAALIRSCYLEGLTYEALADREGLPLAALKCTIQGGLGQMREAARKLGR